MLTVAPTTDATAIRRFLRRDAAYAAYALGDLEPPYAQHAGWFAASGDDGMEGIALVYSGFDPPALFLMGEPRALRALLAAGVGPDAVMLLAPERSATLLREHYTMTHVQPMLRMQLTEDSFNAQTGMPVCPVRPLGPDDSQAVRGLITETAALDARDLEDVAFDPSMLADGVYVGAECDGRLVAMAGTHLIAPVAGLAALGNVMTHPAWRSRGLAATLSAAVIRGLFDRGIDSVVLNVRADNHPAVHVYRRLGFDTAATFLEAQGRRHAGRLDALSKRGIIAAHQSSEKPPGTGEPTLEQENS